MTKHTSADIDRLCEEFRQILLKETHAHGWSEWCGVGLLPMDDDDSIQIYWSNGIIRTYERADWINWNNLPSDGSVKWRRP